MQHDRICVSWKSHRQLAFVWSPKEVFLPDWNPLSPAEFRNRRNFIYAIGGSAEVARRIGINIFEVKVLVYVLAGAIAGRAGITHASLVRADNAFDIVGTELNVIAASSSEARVTRAAMAGQRHDPSEPPLLPSSTIR
jgi:hypothetical protein